MREIWKPIKNASYYEVSNLGRVRSYAQSAKRAKPKLMKLGTNGGGYRTVMLSVTGKPSLKYVHRLVLEAFVGPGNGQYPKHIDFDRSNNNLNNLCWISSVESIRYCWQRKIQKRPLVSKSRLQESQVLEIISDFKKGMSRDDIAIKFDRSLSVIRKILRGQLWPHLQREIIKTKMGVHGKYYGPSSVEAGLSGRVQISKEEESKEEAKEKKRGVSW